MPVPVIVSTKHEGCYFGYITSSASEVIRARTCVLRDARSLEDTRASASMNYFCTVGPTEDRFYGKAIEHVCLTDITAVFDVSASAARAWDAIQGILEDREAIQERYHRYPPPEAYDHWHVPPVSCETDARSYTSENNMHTVGGSPQIDPFNYAEAFPQPEPKAGGIVTLEDHCPRPD